MKTPKEHVTYNEEIVDEICSTLANCHFGVRYLCKHIPHWPSESTIYKWREKYPLFEEKYTRARQAQADFLVSDMMEIASNTENDILVNKDGTNQVNHANIQRDRLRIDTIKWIACKLIPKVYGERNANKDSTQDAISEFRVEE